MSYLKIQNLLAEYFENGVINQKGHNRMVFDAGNMSAGDWYHKWPVGDYYEYKAQTKFSLKWTTT